MAAPVLVEAARIARERAPRFLAGSVRRGGICMAGRELSRHPFTSRTELAKEEKTR
jgi:hypothetical protein